MSRNPLEDKDAENTKRGTKVAKQIRKDLLLENFKNFDKPSEKRDLALILKSFMWTLEKKMVLLTH